MKAPDKPKRVNPLYDPSAPSIPDNLASGLRIFFQRKPRPDGHAAAWPSRSRILLGGMIAAGVIVASMFVFDAPANRFTSDLPAIIVDPINRFTDFGRSSYWLWPLAAIFFALAVAQTHYLTNVQRRILAAIGVRMQYLFAAIAVPGIFAGIVKRLIGRARPLTGDDMDAFLYVPFAMKNNFASMPSGHATTAFAALFAMGALWPATRPAMWLFAVMIAVSRVVTNAHHPSDVIAGACVGALGAILVRNAFAARGLAFTVQPDGSVKPLPGPSRRRLRTLARAIVGKK